MNDFSFSPDAYLQRIGLTHSVEPDEQGLEQLHRAQGFSIPFENFDILLGRGISLSPADIFNKLVLSPRGGYCFELNNLLLMALQHFGFEARPLLARVHLRGTPTARTHQLLLVKIGNTQWLADVGFGGGGLLAPMPFTLDTMVEQDGLQFRVIKSAHYDYMLQQRRQDNWQDLYSFDLTHVGEADIALGNYYTSTSPDSFFTYLRIATLPVPGGRISLADFSLKETLHGEEQITVLGEGQAYLDTLEKHFGIRLDQAYEAIKPVMK